MFDVVMWVKNGAKTLPAVLSQIDHVVPKEAVHKKIMVDDHSKDNSGQIGAEHGWTVVTSEGHGISCAANTALKNVETPFFCSFEQDVVISDEWFSKVYPMIYHENVVVACGVRYASAPPLIRKMEMVGHSIHLEEVSKGLRQKTNNAMGISFDNTIYRTDFVRSIGGFPYVKSNVGQDFSMFLEICKTEKYLWEVNYNVVSLHLKPNSYINELKHQRWYARGIRETFISNGFFPPSKMSRKGYFFNLVKSPLTSFKLLRVYGDPVIFFYHPAFCLMQLLGYIEGKRFA